MKPPPDPAVLAGRRAGEAAALGLGYRGADFGPRGRTAVEIASEQRRPSTTILDGANETKTACCTCGREGASGNRDWETFQVDEV